MKKKYLNKKGIKPPQYCDFSCPYARFAPPDFTGACRKELSVWCAAAKKFNNKNNKCLYLKDNLLTGKNRN
jgi:hypothetical protein